MVLLLLIESFKFSPAPGKEIYWRSQGIARPAVVGSEAFQLPLVVERVMWAKYPISSTCNEFNFGCYLVIWRFTFTFWDHIDAGLTHDQCCNAGCHWWGNFWLRALRICCYFQLLLSTALLCNCRCFLVRFSWREEVRFWCQNEWWDSCSSSRYV